MPRTYCSVSTRSSATPARAATWPAPTQTCPPGYDEAPPSSSAASNSTARRPPNATPSAVAMPDRPAQRPRPARCLATPPRSPCQLRGTAPNRGSGYGGSLQAAVSTPGPRRLARLRTRNSDIAGDRRWCPRTAPRVGAPGLSTMHFRTGRFGPRVARAPFGRTAFPDGVVRPDEWIIGRVAPLPLGDIDEVGRRGGQRASATARRAATRRCPDRVSRPAPSNSAPAARHVSDLLASVRLRHRFADAALRRSRLVTPTSTSTEASASTARGIRRSGRRP